MHLSQYRAWTTHAGFHSARLAPRACRTRRAPRDVGKHGCGWAGWNRPQEPLAALLGTLPTGQGRNRWRVVLVLLVLIAIFGGPIAAHITGHAENAYFTNMTDEYGVPKGPNTRSGSERTPKAATCSCGRCTAHGRRCSWASSPRGGAVHRPRGRALAGFFGGWVDSALSRLRRHAGDAAAAASRSASSPRAASEGLPRRAPAAGDSRRDRR